MVKAFGLEKCQHRINATLGLRSELLNGAIFEVKETMYKLVVFWWYYDDLTAHLSERFIRSRSLVSIGFLT
jgi:hypothetical protein